MYNHYKTFELKTGEHLVLRNAKVEDAKALMHQIKTVDAETPFLAREPNEFNLTLEQEENFLKQHTETDSSFFIVGEVNGEIVANCSVGLVSSNKRYQHRAALGIAITKAHWGKGIGSKMMQACIDWCRHKGVEQIELEVVTANKRGYDMYERFGFEVYGTKKHALKYADGSYADEYFMILELNK